ncbi:uncharacterized protein LOC113427625, partial [Notechis scutatus]|uniref:Uncharacterized protein LOC113427625 n=1 Tax=Notechis scutatus TaxID=8663 RepID=A0A6J1VS76_9SAUR
PSAPAASLARVRAPAPFANFPASREVPLFPAAAAAAEAAAAPSSSDPSPARSSCSARGASANLRPGSSSSSSSSSAAQEEPSPAGAADASEGSPSGPGGRRRVPAGGMQPLRRGRSRLRRFPGLLRLLRLLHLAVLPTLAAGLRCTQPSESCLNGGKCETYQNGTGACLKRREEVCESNWFLEYGGFALEKAGLR